MITTASARLAADVLMRPAELADAAGFARSYQRSLDHIRATEPVRAEGYYTTAGQTERLRALLAERDAGRVMPWVLVREPDDGSDEPDVAGAITLSQITYGPLRSASVGYWIDAGQLRRGLASAALRAVCAVADRELGLHRLEAGTLLDNTASQRVLTGCGFTLYGTAEKYLHINGAWRDHRLFQKILNDRHP
ncbi:MULTISPECIES: GNAT family protein [unclassified Streptomyces]|uniref:GNAT family N-acetyltransferase n=1 Tax=unclassified Streptomyces TaxID=2593676 RepID=UPI00037A08BE|nr:MULTISPECIES: GNAT family protein [unclassified Streptomyces]MYT27328.1 GNAT family N-acetyltransferase [Streptomyces sp. SID8354]